MILFCSVKSENQINTMHFSRVIKVFFFIFLISVQFSEHNFDFPNGFH